MVSQCISICIYITVFLKVLELFSKRAKIISDTFLVSLISSPSPDFLSLLLNTIHIRSICPRLLIWRSFRRHIYNGIRNLLLVSGWNLVTCRIWWWSRASLCRWIRTVRTCWSRLRRSRSRWRAICVRQRLWWLCCTEAIISEVVVLWCTINSHVGKLLLQTICKLKEEAKSSKNIPFYDG